MNLLRDFLAPAALNYLVFYLLWTFAIAPLFALVAVSIRKAALAALALLIEGIGFYFAAAVFLTALHSAATLATMSFVVAAVIGFILVVTNCISTSERAREHVANGDHEMLRLIYYDIYMIPATAALYIIGVFVPALVVTPVTRGLFQLSAWIQTVPVLGFIIEIVAVLTLLGLMLNGIFASFRLVGVLKGLRK